MPHPRGLLEHLLQTPKDFQLPAAVTAVLATIVGMDVASGPEIDHAQARALISDLESDLPPDLGAIAEGVRAAVDGVSLTVRR